MSYDNNNTGIMYRNLRKEKADHPDYTGSVTINGEQFWLSAWLKDAKPDSKLKAKGVDKFLSITFQPSQENRPTKPAPVAHKEGIEGLTDDIPF